MLAERDVTIYLNKRKPCQDPDGMYLYTYIV